MNSEHVFQMRCVTLVFVMIVIVSVTAERRFCPVQSPCSCNYIPNELGVEKFAINCKSQGLSEIPRMGIANETVAIADFSNNKMKRIRKHNFKEVKFSQLTLRNNDLLGIQKESFKPVADILKRLDLSKNDFTEIPPALQDLKVLEYLNIGGSVSKPGPIRRIKRNAFKGLVNLKTLILSGQSIAKLNTRAFDGLGNSLENLDLSNIILKGFPSSIRVLKSLMILNLRRSGDFKIESKAFDGMNSLIDLDLSQNNLGKPDSFQQDSFSGIENSLEYLNLRDCQLTELPESIKLLMKLKKLDLYGNKLMGLPAGSFRSLHSLNDLNIGGHSLKFTADVFSDVSDTLTHLRLQSMSLTELPVDLLKSMSNLQEIDLSKNLISMIPTNFSAGSSVMKYNFDDNNILEISKLAFTAPPSGAFIELSLRLAKISTVTFAGNPCIFSKINFERSRFPCNCDLYRLVGSGVEVIGHCVHKNTPIDIGGTRFNNYYPRRCPKDEVDCSKVLWPDHIDEKLKESMRKTTTTMAVRAVTESGTGTETISETTQRKVDELTTVKMDVTEPIVVVTEPNTDVTDATVDKATEPQVVEVTEPKMAQSTEPKMDESTEPKIDKSTEGKMDKSTEPQMVDETEPMVTTTEMNVETSVAEIMTETMMTESESVETVVTSEPMAEPSPEYMDKTSIKSNVRTDDTTIAHMGAQEAEIATKKEVIVIDVPTVATPKNVVIVRPGIEKPDPEIVKMTTEPETPTAEPTKKENKTKKPKKERRRKRPRKTTTTPEVDSVTDPTKNDGIYTIGSNPDIDPAIEVDVESTKNDEKKVVGDGETGESKDNNVASSVGVSLAMILCVVIAVLWS